MDTFIVLSLVLIAISAQQIKCMSIPGSPKGVAVSARAAPKQRRSVSDNELEATKPSAKSMHTCQMDCDGQGRLCETIASSVSEKMLCLKNRMQCVARCSGKDLKRILQKKKEKEEKLKKKETIRKIDSHIYTIEELIKIYTSSWIDYSEMTNKRQRNKRTQLLDSIIPVQTHIEIL